MPWFAGCPWCKLADAPQTLGPGQYTFWREVMAREDKVRMVQALIDNALDSWEERTARLEGGSCQQQKLA